MKNVDTKNLVLAIFLTLVVVAVWEYFIGQPMQRRQELAAQQQQQIQQQQQAAQPQQPQAAAPATGSGSNVPGVTSGQQQFGSRDAAVEASQRVQIDSQRLIGSINLTGGLIDDLALRGYRETLDPNSPNVKLFSPRGTPIQAADHHTIVENHGPYFTYSGWKTAPGANLKVPGLDTVWTAKSTAPLSSTSPVQLDWDNGQGLVFHRTISIDTDRSQTGWLVPEAGDELPATALDLPRQNLPKDEQGSGAKPIGGFLFTIKDSVENKGTAPVQLAQTSYIARIGTPTVGGYSVLHEGLIGRFSGTQVETTYKSLDPEKPVDHANATGWLGFTDKYWANALVPDPTATFDGKFEVGTVNGVQTYVASMLRPEQTVAPGSTYEVSTGLFSGAKEVATLSYYDEKTKVDNLSYLIDWGYLWFITKPLFRLIEILFHLFGNFGLAILGTTVILKLFFFPLANRSYESMSKMKKVQPEMQKIKDQFPDDKMKQQQATMALYKEQKINPLSGCLPMLFQIPVFFALYKVLFVTIEMRQAPFFGWIHDLSAPDPTTIFNLFGLVPWSPPAQLMVGFWVILMGCTMFIQMQLNPAPPDPTQAMMFRYMPIVFTYMLAAFPAGLVIYYCWNNSLSILQQTLIMKKNGAKIELWDNLKSIFIKKKTPDGSRVDA
ncbi:membrane protein insertase YidC [Labrys miyagiensis]|uniref:Membrane protein insertase YidC n=1 Tax=Labrys miyagiensis TaxID=346912 RepID=A0ABQ6CPN9_9HYPH|nr:membrane protein insertase YidC [Labrys miyagiensis]GLS22293.1 membrane protein insertase YidC [Labrys miyagiensis]